MNHLATIAGKTVELKDVPAHKQFRAACSLVARSGVTGKIVTPLGETFVVRPDGHLARTVRQLEELERCL